MAARREQLCVSTDEIVVGDGIACQSILSLILQAHVPRRTNENRPIWQRVRPRAALKWLSFRALQQLTYLDFKEEFPTVRAATGGAACRHRE
jgi:hypothetical protein